MQTLEPVAGNFPNYHDTIPPRTTRLTAAGLPADAPAAVWLAQSAQLLQSLLQRALDEGADIRPIGGDWSFSVIGAGGPTMLAPDGLGPSWPVAADWMAAGATLAPANLHLAAGGISIKALNRALEKAGQSLWTSGASNGQSIAGAIAIPRARLLEGIAIMSEAFVSTGGAPTSMTVRFVRRSAGLLAFTRFEHGAVIDFDGLRHPDSARAYQAIVAALVARNFPFTQHWGKMGEIDRANLETQFGPSLTAWREARATLLDDPTVRALFSNRLVRDLGLV